VDRTALTFGVNLGRLGTVDRGDGASPKEVAEELVRRAERWGIWSWCTHAPSGPTLAGMLAEVAS
jgi:hypothetical protein